MPRRRFKCWGGLRMNKGAKAAKARLTQIQAAEDGAKDMQTIAAAMAELPSGQLKKLLTEDILAILEKYGVVME